jgi:hypothetical protein
MRRRPLVLAIILVCATAAGTLLLDATLLDQPTYSDKNHLSGTLAPGLTATGVTRPGILTAAHERVIETESYTIHGAVHEQYANGTVRTHYVWTGQRSDAPLRSFYRLDHIVDQPRFNDRPLTQLSYYHQNNQTYQAASSPTTTAYQVQQDPTGKLISTELVRQERLSLLFSVFNGTVGATVSQHNESQSQPTYRVRLTRLSSPEALAVADQMDSIRNASLTAIIGGWGIIYPYHLRYTGMKAEETVEVHESARVTALGQTSIQQPSWYQHARNNTTA